MKGIPHEEAIAELLAEDAEFAAGYLADALTDAPPGDPPAVIALAIDDLERAGYTIVLSGPAKPAPAVSGVFPSALAENAGIATRYLARAIEDGTAEELAAAIRDLAAAGYAFSLSGPDPAVKRAVLKRAKAPEKLAKAKARRLAASAKARRTAPAAKRGVAPAKAKHPAATAKAKAAQTPARPRRPAAPATRRAASAAAAL